MIVVDASALTDFLLGRKVAVEAFELELSGREEQPLHAPELVEPETLNALRRLTRHGELSEERAAAAVRDLGSVRMTRYPHAPFRERTRALRHALTAYDASYLALAEGLEDPVLLTANHGLAIVARRSLGAAGVRLVA